LFSSDQVTTYAKPPTTVPSAVAAATSAREKEEKWFADMNKNDLPSSDSEQPQQQQQQQQQTSISAFPSAPTTMPTTVSSTNSTDEVKTDATAGEETIEFTPDSKAAEKPTNQQQHYTLVVKEGERGFGPETLFGSLVTEDVNRVRVVDAPMRCARQLRVFLRLCEVVLSHVKTPVLFELRTQRDPPPSEQMEILQQISNGLHSFNGSRLVVTFAETAITERIVAFNNGSIVRCSRGIDIYCTHDMSPWAVGSSDHELCACHASTFEYTIPAPQ